MSVYRSSAWYANRRALGTALARARAQGEADHARLTAGTAPRLTRDPMECAGYAPESLESPTNLESRK